MIEVDALGMMQLGKTVLTYAVQLEGEAMTTGRKMPESDGIGREGNASNVLTIAQHLKQAAAIVRNAQREGILRIHVKVVIDIAGIEGQALWANITKTKLANGRDNGLNHAVDAYAKIAQQIEALQVGTTADGNTDFQYMFPDAEPGQPHGFDIAVDIPANDRAFNRSAIEHKGGAKHEKNEP